MCSQLFPLRCYMVNNSLWKFFSKSTTAFCQFQNEAFVHEKTHSSCTCILEQYWQHLNCKNSRSQHIGWSSFFSCSFYFFKMFSFFFLWLHFFCFSLMLLFSFFPWSWRYSFFTHFNFLALFFENIFQIFLNHPDHLSFLPSFNYFTTASPPAHFFAFWLQNHTSPTFNTSPFFLPPLKYFTHFKLFPVPTPHFQILLSNTDATHSFSTSPL